LLDAHRAQQGLLAQAFSNQARPFQVTDRQAMGQAAQNMLAGPLGFAPAGITAWHGSPHVFDKFDSSKIGTGEGAQAYGHGLYLAESPKVAKEYQAATSKDRFITSNGFFDPSELEHLNVKVKARSGDLDRAIEEARKYAVPDHDYPETAAKAARDLARLQALQASGGIKVNQGSLYKVDLPDSAVAKMLDWDKPLSQQAPEVKEAAKYLQERMTGPFSDSLTGDQMLRHIEATRKFVGGAKAESILQKLGIPGIRYLDGGSRGAGQGSSNFVVFPGEENILQILERNGQPIR
jgi:hypothetical protein